MKKEFILGVNINGKNEEIKAVESAQVEDLETRGAKILYVARPSFTKNTPCKKAKFFHDGKNKEIKVFGNSDKEMYELIEQAFEGATRITLTTVNSEEQQNPAAFIFILLAALIVLTFVPIFILLNLFGKLEGAKKTIAKIRKTEYKKKTAVLTPFGEKMRKIAIAFAIISEAALIGGIIFLVLAFTGALDFDVAFGVGGVLLSAPIVYDLLYFILLFIFKKQNKLYSQATVVETEEAQIEKTVVEKPAEKVEIVTVSKIEIGKREFKKSEIEQLFAYVWMRNYNELTYDEAFEKLHTYFTESGLIDGDGITDKDIEHLLTLIWARRYNELKFDDALNKILERLTVDYEVEKVVPISTDSDSEVYGDCISESANPSYIVNTEADGDTATEDTTNVAAAATNDTTTAAAAVTNGTKTRTKKKNGKALKIAAIVTSVVMVVGLGLGLGLGLSLQPDDEYGLPNEAGIELDITFELTSDNTYIVSAYFGKETQIKIPATYQGKPVTGIGEKAFSSCEDLESITISDSVISIGDRAFSYCSSLTSITIPDSVMTIGDYAFSCCNKLTSVIIGNGVTAIGDYAFENCSEITSVYYKGTKAEWNGISIDSSCNQDLTSATIYYYTETAPTAEGNYWHYDTYGKIVVFVW